MPWEQGQRKKQTESTNGHMGEGTGSPKPGQGDMCLPNSSPAAGTMAERAPSEKQVAEAEERTEKENPGKACGAALW